MCIRDRYNETKHTHFSHNLYPSNISSYFHWRWKYQKLSTQAVSWNKTFPRTQTLRFIKVFFIFTIRTDSWNYFRMWDTQKNIFQINVYVHILYPYYIILCPYYVCLHAIVYENKKFYIIPVSYTHLDVYKRQILQCPVK